MADQHSTPEPGAPAEAAATGRDELLELYRAAGSGELPALVLIRAVVPAFLDGRGLDGVLSDPDDQAASVLHATRQWAADSPLASVAPVVLAAGTQAVGALAHSFTDEDGGLDLPGLRHWFTVKADTVRAEEQQRGVESGADCAVIAMCAELVDDLGPGPRREPDPAAEVLAAWATPGADLYELMVSAAWFAAAMLSHVLGFEAERIMDYLDGRAAKIYPVADRLRRAARDPEP